MIPAPTEIFQSWRRWGRKFQEWWEVRFPRSSWWVCAAGSRKEISLDVPVCSPAGLQKDAGFETAGCSLCCSEKQWKPFAVCFFISFTSVPWGSRKEKPFKWAQ